MQHAHAPSTVAHAPPVGPSPASAAEGPPPPALAALARDASDRACRELEALLVRPVTLTVRDLDYRALSPAEPVPGSWPSRVLVVRQALAGALRGELAWVVGETSAANLLEALDLAPARPGPLTTLEREALVEVGNVVLGTVAEALGRRVPGPLRALAPTLAGGPPKEVLLCARRAAEGAEVARWWLEGLAFEHRVDHGVVLCVDPVSAPWFRQQLAAGPGPRATAAQVEAAERATR